MARVLSLVPQFTMGALAFGLAAHLVLANLEASRALAKAPEPVVIPLTEILLTTP